MRTSRPRHALTRFGFVFQQAHLMTTLCLLDNIVLPGLLAGLRPRSEVTARGEELMERMGIDELANQRRHRGPQRHRV